MAHSQKQHRISALDGLRGVALLCVLASHSGLPAFGGSVIMFVLSGYLITTQLMKERERTGTIAIRAFYARRAWRLLPALLVMLAVVNLAVTLTRSQEASALLSDTLYTLIYLNNWAQLTHHSTFLAHLWSLSVQEQFYVAWPVLMASLLHYWRAVLFVVCLALAVGSWSLRVGLLHGGSIASVYLPTLTRVDSIFLGCALAVGMSMPMYRRVVQWAQAHRMAVEAVALCAASVLGAHLMSYGYDNLLTYSVGMPVVGLCTGLVIAICCLPQTTRLSRALAHPVLVHIGCISYGVYLWHYPLIALLTPVTPYAGVLGVMGGLVLGEVSYRVIERPLLKRDV